MSEQTGIYKIQIKTENDGSGAAKAASQMKELGAQAEVSHKSLRAIERLLSQGGLGQIGELLRMAFNPVLLAVAGIVEIVKEWKKGLDAIHEQHLKLTKDARDYSEELRTAGAAALQSQVDRVADWNRQMEHLRDNIDQAAIAQKNLLELDKERTAELRDQSSLTASLAEARTATLEEEGVLSHEQAEIRILQIKLQQKQIDDDMADRAKQREIAAKQSEARAAGVTAGKASDQLSIEEPDRARLQHLLNLAQGAGKRFEGQQGAADTAADEARAKFKSDTYGISYEDAKAQQGFIMTDKEKPLADTIEHAESIRANTIKQKDLAAGYENQIKDLDADIEVNRKLVKAKLLLVDQLNEEAGQMEKMRQDAKSASAAGLAQSGGITNEAILRIAEELSRRNFGTGGNQIGNFAALGVEGSLERDIAQAIAGIRVHAAGVDNTAFLKEVLAALRELAASHKLNAEQLAAANAEISNIIGTIAAHGPRY